MTELISPLFVSLLCYGLFRLATVAYRDFTTPLRIRDLDGPKNPSFAYGNYNEMAGDQWMTDKWRAKYGRNFQFMGLFNIRELHTSDPKALAHIAFNTVLYQKAPASRYNTKRLVGNGILAVELDEHKQQRRIMTPAFGVRHIRELTPIFVKHADHVRGNFLPSVLESAPTTPFKLRDFWAAHLAQENGAARMDVLPWLRRMALDSVGEAGFNYKFDSLDPNGKPSELMAALTQLLHSAGAQTSFVVRFAQATFPILRLLPMPGAQVFAAAHKKLFDVGAQLMAESKAYIEAAGGEKNVTERQDLLSLLIKANMASDLPDSQRLCDHDVIAQVPTFVVAGHENTSSGVAWALHALSLNHAIQDKLREELLSARSETPAYDELNSLPYLENVVRETMRLYPPVEYTGRVAMADDVLPLSEPYVDKKGKVHQGIPVLKGQKIHIPLRAMNIDKALWGGDADEFKPERWDNLPEAVSAIPSVYANLSTFYAGSHSCIGFRFSIMEQKAVLFSLVRAFEFENALPLGSIGRTSATSLQRPIVLADRKKGTQMPLIVKPYRSP